MPSKKKLLFLLFFASSALYIIKLLNITIPCATKNSPFLHVTFHEEKPFTLKELNLLSNIIARKPNANLLFFGLNPQFLPLADTSICGSAIFLEDDGERIRRFSPKSTRRVAVHSVKYNETAASAYELLRHVRKHADCSTRGGSSCRLALAGLPREIYERSWDVVVVDGPRGDRLDAPGRMAAIYTAAVIARMGSGADVLVHDVDRMIEKWFSWEFLCHENLVSAKGNLWHFRLQGSFQSVGFCSEKMVQVL